MSFIGGRSLCSEGQDPGVAGLVEQDAGRLLASLTVRGRLAVLVLVFLKRSSAIELP